MFPLPSSTGQLPANLPNPPTFRKINPADSPIMTVKVQSDALPLAQVNDYADNILARQISPISGVGLVSVNSQHQSFTVYTNDQLLSADPCMRHRHRCAGKHEDCRLGLCLSCGRPWHHAQQRPRHCADDYNVIVLDVMLPSLDGFSVLRTIT